MIATNILPIERPLKKLKKLKTPTCFQFFRFFQSNTKASSVLLKMEYTKYIPFFGCYMCQYGGNNLMYREKTSGVFYYNDI